MFPEAWQIDNPMSGGWQRGALAVTPSLALFGGQLAQLGEFDDREPAQ
jgi:hypothetical protein